MVGRGRVGRGRCNEGSTTMEGERRKMAIGGRKS